MSGRQQHYLPQFLQRNFYARKNRKEYYVHVHRKASSFQPNTSSIGQQRDFYGNPATSEADAHITRAESLLGDVVRRLTSGNEASVTQDEFAVLMASLSLRTKKMREALKDAGPRIMTTLSKVVAETNIAEQQFDKFLADKQQFNVLVEAELAKTGRLTRNQAAKLRTAARSHVAHELRLRRNSMVSDLKSQFALVMVKLIAEAANVADGAFLKLFETSSAPDQRIALFKGFNYTVVEAAQDEESFVLGDCAVVAVQSDGRPKLALGNIDDELNLSEVWLPVSPRLAVVGCRAGLDRLATVAEVNRLSAMLSHEFFISDAPSSDRISELASLIGSAEPLLTSEELVALSKFESS